MYAVREEDTEPSRERPPKVTFMGDGGRDLSQSAFMGPGKVGTGMVRFLTEAAYSEPSAMLTHERMEETEAASLNSVSAVKYLGVTTSLESGRLDSRERPITGTVLN